jgi:integrase
MRKEILPRGIHRRNGSLVISYSVGGKVRYQSLGDCSVESAKEQLLLTKLEIRKGTWQPKQSMAAVPAPVTYKVEDLWQPYLTHYANKGGKDASRQTIAWNHLKDTFAVVPVTNVTTDLINQYISARQGQGISNGTVNRETVILQAMFRLGARSTGANGKPVVDRLPAFPSKLKEGPPKKGFIKDQEYLTLMSRAKAPWMLAFIECAFSFGFRKSELLNLRCNQVDLLERRITLYETKNGRSRTVMMTGKVYERLRVLLRGKKDEAYVFTRKDGGRVVDPRQCWYDLCVACNLGRYVPAKRANGEDYEKYVGLNLHDFRRSAVKAMKKRNIPDRVVMEIGGWRTRAVFDRYFPVDEEELADAAKRIENGREVRPTASSETQTKVKQSDLLVS